VKRRLAVLVAVVGVLVASCRLGDEGRQRSCDDDPALCENPNAIP